MDPYAAAEQSKHGKLVGQGCEAHEAKVQARNEKVQLKRKAKEQGKQRKKMKKQEAKLVQKGKRGSDVTPESTGSGHKNKMADDEEAMFNGSAA